MRQEGARHPGADRFRDGEVPSGIVLHRNGSGISRVVGLVASKVKGEVLPPVIAFAESSEDRARAPGAPSRGCTCAMRWNCSIPATPAMGRIWQPRHGGRVDPAQGQYRGLRAGFEAVIGELGGP